MSDSLSDYVYDRDLQCWERTKISLSQQKYHYDDSLDCKGLESLEMESSIWGWKMAQFSEMQNIESAPLSLIAG